MRKTILIVEDDPISMLLLEIILKDYRLIKATDGQEAVLKYERNQGVIDLVLLDLKLPLLSGFEVLNKIKIMNKNVISIAQTAHATNINKEACLEKGFINFISKPINKTDLLNIIYEYLG